MLDRSHLDSRYFDGWDTYNCPFCNRNHVPFKIRSTFEFDWTGQKKCFGYLVECQFCGKVSLHHSWQKIADYRDSGYRFEPDLDIDASLFHSIPSSFFVQDERIPKVLRELISEADGCLKMNFLTGASACTRKTIYEFAVLEKAEGENYDERIKSLKTKFPEIDPGYFDVLCHIKDMTSDKVHEQSWDKWDSKNIRFFLELLRTIFHEVYVVPREKQNRAKAVSTLLEGLKNDKKTSVKADDSGGKIS